ncbi:VOC family protein [Lysobacter niabensis]|jgi:catechol 2,3-dioxygenase-like lactoylglutathione lyase family enzyme|uniref:VOC family protein n=1 Tax=Agrilutibacter niabensis TaxID=380628 RepID=UPI00360CF618
MINAHEQSEGRLFLQLYCHDQEQMAEFYERVLPFTRVSDYIHGTGGGGEGYRHLVLARKDNGGAQIHLIHAKSWEEKAMIGNLHFCVSVRNPLQIREFIERRGLNVVAYHEAPWQEALVFQDPAGNTVSAVAFAPEVVGCGS